MDEIEFDKLPEDQKAQIIAFEGLKTHFRALEKIGWAVEYIKRLMGYIKILETQLNGTFKPKRQ